MKLGQHFLKNKEILKKIANAVDIQSGDVVIEIGAGHGELTENLKQKTENLKLSAQGAMPTVRQGPAFGGKTKNVKIIAIEKDKNLADFLKKKFETYKDIEIVYGDVLKILQELTSRQSLVASRYKLVGNIPYYITGHLLRIIGDLEHKPVLSVFLMQKEVAERICAKPPEINLLAASVQFWTEPKILFNVSKNEFSPPPEVESAVLELKTRKMAKNEEKNAYYRAIKAIFKQPRKTILNNLVESGIKKEDVEKVLSRAGISPKLRPQNLSIEDIKNLSFAINV